MCTNGSRYFIVRPANARRTGKPSPSRPWGAVVTVFTGRSTLVAISTAEKCTKSLHFSGVTAGMVTSFDSTFLLPRYGKSTEKQQGRRSANREYSSTGELGGRREEEAPSLAHRALGAQLANRPRTRTMPPQRVHIIVHNPLTFS